MQLKSFIALALFGNAIAGPVVKRDLQTIQTALNNISKSVQTLDTSVKAISGKPEDAAKILQDSQAVQMTLQTSTQQVQATEPLSLNDAIGLQNTAGGLTTQVMTTIMDLTAKKDLINQVPGGKEQVVQQLQQQKTASNAFADAIVQKVPDLAQNIAKQQTGQIGAAFDMGIQAFST